MGEDAQEHAHSSVGIAIVDLALELANELLGEVEEMVTHLGHVGSDILGRLGGFTLGLELGADVVKLDPSWVPRSTDGAPVEGRESSHIAAQYQFYSGEEEMINGGAVTYAVDVAN